MSNIYSFEKLDVWQNSRKFALEIRKTTRKFPNSELFGLVSQLNRASLSIASNIAEGSTRNTGKDQAHFTSIAYGSCMEVLCQLLISFDLAYIDEDELSQLRNSIEEISNKLNALRTYQLSRK
jgi:four helix bundle protein